MCSWFEGIVLFGHLVVCEAAGWPVRIAAIGAVVVVLVVSLWSIRGARGVSLRIGAMLVLISVVLLSVSAGLPALQPQGAPPPGGRVVVLIDASESVRRGGVEALDAARGAVARQVQQMASDLPDGADWRGSVWAFGASPRAVAPDAALTDLASSITGADLGELAAQSNLETATAAALRDIASGPGAGLVMMITDGNQTDGDVMDAVVQAQQVGVALHVMAVGSDRPAMGLLSYDIGPDQAIGRPAVLRATVQGGGVLRWGINGAPEPDHPVADADAPRAVRMPVGFGERGLNFVDLGFAIEGQAARAELAYTLVRGPARILVFGAAPWVDAVDPVDFLIERADSRDPVALASFDAIIVDALDPAQFKADFPERLVETAAGGVGVFVVNGPLRGSQEDMQRLSDWEETALGPVLPVNSDPAEYIAESPKRDVMIIIDTSGSMSGSNIRVARAAAHLIIDSVRPQDSLVIVPFSTDAGRAFEAPRAGPDAIQRARGFVDRLQVAGDTNMAAAIRRARQLKGNNCALFIVGDGGYPAGQITGSPICYTTAIGVQGVTLPGIDTTWGQQVPINSAQQLGQITFQVFQPEPRTTFWQEGPLRAIPVDEVSEFEMPVPVRGVALSYPRPEATDISIMSDPPRAPVLAFRQDPTQRSLRTGVFLGVVPEGLPAGPEGWASAVMRKLVGWDDPDLFDIDFQLEGEDVQLEITPLGDQAPPTNIGASILLGDGTSHGISMGSPNSDGKFAGTGRISLSNTTMRGILNLEVGGGQTQSIPLRLPAILQSGPVGAGSLEAFGFGVDRQLLDDIASASGGLNLAQARPTIGRERTAQRSLLIWPWLAGFAATMFAGSLFFGGVRR